MVVSTRTIVLFLLCITVLTPLLFYTDRRTTFNYSAEQEFVQDDVTAFTVGGADSGRLNLLPQETTSTILKEPIGIVYSDHSSNINNLPQGEHVLSRVLSATNEDGRIKGKKNSIKLVTDGNQSSYLEKTDSVNGEDAIDVDDNDGKLTKSSNTSETIFTKQGKQHIQSSRKVNNKGSMSRETIKHNGETPANERMKAMDQSLMKGRQIQDDCATSVKKLRAMLHSSEDQLRVHKKQTLFLTQLTAKTLPKGLHCLPLRLTTEYYNLNSSQQQFPNQEKLEDPGLYHYAIFSDNILATAVVVNSTAAHAKDASKHVFHIVTDRLNYAAMRMWFLANPPGKAAIQVQNIEDFTWLNSSYSPVLKQLGSPSMIDYYFKTHRATSDSNLKFRNPKYLSMLNHLRFYLPEIFPKLKKVLFLDDDVVVQKDLTGLWSINLKGNINGAVQTCAGSFHRFDRYLNFSNPLVAKNFNPHACGWAYGMNVFDLVEWKKQNITEVYHTWQKLNHDRQLWKLGTLPPGLITFWKRTFPLNRSWHVLGLGYNPNVNQKDIERAAVIHYNGNMKPWLEISIPKFRGYWTKYVDYNIVYLRECNLNP
ncbi:hypothetical protein TSUD_204030 [Trifolium subterraneum]|uniref:Hexosyltransferase n=1 Tax=Trifolium subterraneum TaxID=3900 RepID=A0A2Z6LHR6_TRISU|nr:hypothetical protein TSUD_204030 [Trifolium subterraneum]